jgi:hypothetical protein
VDGRLKDNLTLSREQKAERIHNTKIDNKSFERVGPVTIFRNKSKVSKFQSERT